MAHFTRATFQFLRDLDNHNNVAWFHDHKTDYEQHVRGPALQLVPQWLAVVPPHYVGRASKLGGSLAPQHRDLRFARDKTPYRTHVAIRLRHRLALPGSPGPTFLLWISPERSFLSAGVRNAAGEARRRIVAGILHDPEGWLDAREGLQLSDEDMLQNAPAAPENVAADLRRRHFTAEIPIPQRALVSKQLASTLDACSRRLLPLNEFLAGSLYG